MRILIADDDLVARLAMEDVARRCGRVEVVLAEDGESAWRALVGGPFFDLVCLDVRMPAPDGLQLLERMRAGLALRRVPVMLISSTADRATVQAALQCDVQGFVVKPVGVETASRILRMLEACDNQVLEPVASAAARLQIAADRHARYVEAFRHQLRGLVEIAVALAGSAPLQATGATGAAGVIGTTRAIGATEMAGSAGDAPCGDQTGWPRQTDGADLAGSARPPAQAVDPAPSRGAAAANAGQAASATSPFATPDGFLTRARACQTAALTLGAVRIEQIIADAAALAPTAEPPTSRPHPRPQPPLAQSSLPQPQPPRSQPRSQPQSQAADIDTSSGDFHARPRATWTEVEQALRLALYWLGRVSASRA